MKLTQDRMQRLSVYFHVVLELYRVITCSLLVIFVPQKCDDHICTVAENLTWNSTFYNVTLVLNFCTLFGFCPMYLVEMWRENRLIKYLDVNPDMPNDNESVAAALYVLPIDKKQKIVSMDKIYQKICYAMMFVYFVNALFSGIVVFDYYLNNQTASTLVTYLIYMSTKFAHSFEIANTKENVFYSAYLTTNVQYNDIDSSLHEVAESSQKKLITDEEGKVESTRKDSGEFKTVDL